MDNPKRAYVVDTTEGPFVFLNDNLELAADHASHLANDPNFPEIVSEATYLGFAKYHETGFIL